MTAPVLSRAPRTAVPATPHRPRRPARWVIGATVTVVVVLAFWSVDITWARLADLPSELVRYGWLMFSSPTWEKLPDALWQTWQSVQMAWVGTVLGILIATPLSLIAARGFGHAWLRAVLRFVFSTIRAVPEIIFAIIILSMTGLTPLTGALALAINGVGTLGKWGYEAVEAVPPGPIEAARAAGGSPVQVLRWGVWPQATPVFLSFWLYRFEINVRSSAVLGLIGVGGIGDMLTTYTQYREWSTVGMLLIVVIAVTMAIDGISGRIRRRIMEGARVR
ncbi:phosphonate ABC transporter, permease protein PhnE [Microbacterium imperiale]|uniref:ABC transporter permease n=1 Tax=Microbacterium imperiale TaxID=33884 RepID=A0A9W6M4H7_9MICO|nr:phosphonate ABC transporter, permease protein PhnE [Microbacterium imperiale]MBP2421767.1 phosphonate transport system permease protein [Microbacterium imperiale]MDS0199132.1 phosphonate ABC transporter, permease protein PhnE [Microbacterium imperiale]BFE39070.1 phosphonate ABC transporter, permease protein PhnE [Microbacterium imperiale]GLJ81061.1 ABC transporter permease [Microbacterium imperiale]